MPSSACDWSSDVCSSDRSEEHTSELQSRSDLVCRLLLEKKKNTMTTIPQINIIGSLAGSRNSRRVNSTEPGKKSRVGSNSTISGTRTYLIRGAHRCIDLH